jgi:predicted branched-subunit amino acid permease
MRDIVRAALWRDIVGFIPVYTGFLIFGLWFGVYHTKLEILQFLKLPGSGLELWWLLPLAIALADYLEDACHLRYLRLDEKGEHPSIALTLFSFTMSALKTVGFAGAIVCTLAAIVAGTFEAASDLTDWRAKFAILISTALLIPILLFVAGVIAQLASGPTKVRSGGIKKMSKAVGAD